MKLNHRLKVWLLKYVPDPSMDTCATMAVLVEEDGTGTFANAQFIKDWDKIVTLDPMADIEFLEEVKDEVEDAWGSPEERHSLIRILTDSLSNTLQIAESPVATDDIQIEVDRLVKFNLGQV